ncbi:MAG: phenylacetate--CoA ligase family protein [Alphaproteobacteria bacterium]|nr:MAG: phenylacetate--CoA ligase family protein [Alphaproteobacteria bacterium]
MSEIEGGGFALPRSAIQDVTWPAVPAAAAAGLLALLQQLEHTQWWAPERLLEQQLRQASVLLSHAAKHVPFHRARLDEAGIRIRPGRTLYPDEWARIPIMTRDDIQAAGTALHADVLPAGHGPIHRQSSSGSTGKPIESLGTRMTQLLWAAFSVREHLWHRRDPRGVLASIRGFATGKGLYPAGLRLRSWGFPIAALYHTGPAVGLSVMTSTEQQAQWLARADPDYLLTFPSALRALARHCREAGIALPRLRQARTLSEVLSPETRAEVEATWGIKVCDMYSAREVGYMALQCPDHDHYHVQAEGVLVEMLDEAGAPCPPGRAGRIVVTPLHNFAMPLLRYDIGDYAVPGRPCPCGRGLPVLTRITGRVRNMLRLPGGGEAWPLIGEPWYTNIPAIRQYQMVQTALQRLELHLVVDRPLTAGEEAELRRIVVDRIGHPFEIALIYRDAIPRGPGGKFEDFKCELPPPSPAEGSA